MARLLVLAMAALPLAVGSAVASAGCSRAQLGLPALAASATSPDGRYRAFVRNRPSIDPPAQSLWLGPVDGDATEIQRLSEDQARCQVVVWAGDSRSVAFLVQDARLIVVDTATRRVRVDRWLVTQDGYPPTREVRSLALSLDGAVVEYKACPHGSERCTAHVEAVD